MDRVSLVQKALENSKINVILIEYDNKRNNRKVVSFADVVNNNRHGMYNYAH